MATCAPLVKQKYERLSSLVKPSHYNLTLKPCLQTFSLDGKVEIDVDIKEKETGVIKLHSDGLQIKKALITKADGSSVNTSVEYGKEMISLHLDSAISPQKIKIALDFNGELRKHMKGFYRSNYKGEDGKERVLASTQFESTFARLAFPCFDEPEFKATFDVELTVDKKYTALSNMPVANESSVDEDWKRVKFSQTPIMSTYLLAFAVGELEYIQGTTKGGVDVRIYTVPGKKEQGHFSLELAIRALDWYGEWFGIPYALPKCDLIAIPDFHMGAMENWGLVTFREVALLFDPLKTSSRQKAYIALVVAHELAHLWFGDLVTMVWWTDLWLKEGFASFMEYLFVGHNYDEFKIWLRFVRDEVTSGMQLDALKSSHPIEVDIDNPNELDEIYDSITYSKSNCVNRMLCEYLGEETFQKGLRIYLKRHAYANAVTEDLWNALSEASGQDIKGMMSGWTKQMGFPVVDVEEVKNESGSRVLKLSQKRFIANGSEDENNSKWMIPITTVIGSKGEEGPKSIFKDITSNITINASSTDVIKLNRNTGGFYRVAYSGPLFHSLVQAFQTLGPLDRFGFASDTFGLMVNGRYSASQFLSLVNSCSSEEEYAVWGALDDGISSLANVLEQSDDGLKKRLDAFVIKVLDPVLKRIGWEAKEGEDAHKGQLRGLLINQLARSNHSETIQAAIALFQSKKTEINADIRQSVYATVARNGTTEQVKELVTMFETCGFPEIERNCMYSFPQTGDNELLQTFFDYAFVQGKVRTQDLIWFVAGATATAKGREFTWDYYKNNQATIQPKMGGTKDSLYQRVFSLSCKSFCTEEKAKEVENLFCNNASFDADSISALDRPIRQATESIRNNARLLSTNAKGIEEFLNNHSF